MRDRVLPFYVVCDESYSMSDHLDTLRARLRELHHCVRNSPVVSPLVRFCLIGFADVPRLIVPLSRPHDLGDIGTLSTRAASNFGAAFTLLRDTIERDLSELRRQSYRIYRPTVFFLSDGQPTDPATWRLPHDRLLDPTWPDRPTIVAFGIGDADAETIRTVGRCRAFLSTGDGGTTPGEALRRFAEALTDSMLSTGAPSGHVEIPDQVSGYRTLTANDR